MEKILTYNGRQVRFKSTAALPLRYKNQTGRDLLADLSAVLSCWRPGKGEDSGAFSKDVDLSLVYDIIWAMAKTADPELPPPLEWLDTFEDGLPAFAWFGELAGLMTASFGGTLKNPKAAATPSRRKASCV